MPPLPPNPDETSAAMTGGPAAAPHSIERMFETFHQSPHGDFKPTFYNPFEIKHRRRTTKSQFRVLETSFMENPKPNAAVRRALASKLGMTPRAVQVWFQNRRAKKKSQSSQSATAEEQLSESEREAMTDSSLVPTVPASPAIGVSVGKTQAAVSAVSQKSSPQAVPVQPLSCPAPQPPLGRRHSMPNMAPLPFKQLHDAIFGPAQAMSAASLYKTPIEVAAVPFYGRRGSVCAGGISFNDADAGGAARYGQYGSAVSRPYDPMVGGYSLGTSAVPTASPTGHASIDLDLFLQSIISPSSSAAPSPDMAEHPHLQQFAQCQHLASVFSGLVSGDAAATDALSSILFGSNPGMSGILAPSSPTVSSEFSPFMASASAVQSVADANYLMSTFVDDGRFAEG